MDLTLDTSIIIPHPYPPIHTCMDIASAMAICSSSVIAAWGVVAAAAAAAAAASSCAFLLVPMECAIIPAPGSEGP